MKIMDILYVPFGYLMRGLNVISGGNYLLSLLFFAIAMKLILLFFAVKQHKTQIKAARLRPKMAAIEKKYAGRNDRATMQKKNEEIMALQQKEGYSPLAGCLPMLIQFPIIIALYNVVRNPLTYICRASTEAISNIIERIGTLTGSEISANTTQIALIGKMRECGLENFGDLGFNTSLIPKFTVFGNAFDLSVTPSFTPENALNYWLLLIPVFTFVSYFFSMKITRRLTMAAQPLQNDAQSATANKIMDFTMPLMSVFFTFALPAAIGVYWIFQSLITMLQQFILVKVMPFPTFTEEDYKAAEREYKVKNKGGKSGIGTSPNAGKVRSLHHIDDDDDDTAPAPVAKEAESEKEKTGEILPSGERTSGVESAPLKSDDRERKN